VNALTANLAPRCVGRYLIDMPADAHIFQFIEVDGVQISTEPMTLDAYRRGMQQRGEELKAAKSHFGYRYLYADQEVEGIADARYFVSLGSIFESPDSVRIIEAYRWSDGYQIKLQVEASDARNSSYFKEQPDAREASYMNTYGSRLRHVIDLLSKTRGRADDVIPSEPGMCFHGGFLAEKARHKENTQTQFVLDSHRDISFDMDTDSDIVTTDNLMQRGGAINKVLSQKRGYTVRSGVVPLQGVAAEEWLMAGMNAMGVHGYHFLLEGNARIGSPRSPLINLVLDVGSENRLLNALAVESASLTEAESVALWDKITRTLRPRPNAF